MITNAQDMLAALRRGVWCGVILYEGPSALDGAPIVVIANRITSASDNGKTGAMVQSFVIRSDVDPVTALNTGADASICGNCQHRPRIERRAGKSKRVRTCYVNVGRSVRSVYAAYQRGRYARPGVDYDARILPALFAGLAFRSGTYGDPTAAPYQVWRAATLLARAITGYTHQWKQKRFRHFARLCMASVDSVAEMAEAHAMGWRTFRVRTRQEPKQAGEAICPASAEAGHKTDCAACSACGGLSAKARVSMVIIAHGSTAVHFEQERLAA
jgi:hypothetical protein